MTLFYYYSNGIHVKCLILTIDVYIVSKFITLLCGEVSRIFMLLLDEFHKILE